MTELIRLTTKQTFSPVRRALVILAGATLLAACGSDDGGSGNTGGAGGGSGSGGSSGSGGTSGSGGASSTGGSSSGGTSSGGGAGTGSGGANTGGTTGSAGAGTGGGGGPGEAVVFDDFETGSDTTPDPAKWSIYNPNANPNPDPSGPPPNTVELTTEQARSGTRSIKVDVNMGGAMLMTQVGLPPPNGAVHFRVWARFANGAGTPAAWSNHVTFIESGGLADNGDVDQGDEVRIGGQAGMLHANLSHGDGLSPSPWSMPCTLCTPPPPNDEWVCIRGYFDVANERVQAWMGETEFVNATMASDWHAMASTYPESLERIGFGWEAYGSVANTVYYDDIAIGYAPIDCE